ncbi:hypothetical protein B0H14DRAFT_2162436, partial [Mycena olivaceomarginata]
RIGLLALQETHLSSADNDKLNTLFEKNLVIFSTTDPLHPGAKGTVIVLNKRLVNVNEVKQDVLIEGRALILTVNWHTDLTLRFLAIYAPNELSENAKFFGTLKEVFKDLPHPDFVLGDFNMV